jgi:hypothetical protein
MPGKLLYEYAVVRLVPRVEREEFINAGIVLFVKQQRFLQCRIRLDRERLSALCCTTDAEELQRYLDAFDRICRGDSAGGPIALLDAPSRFRWLTATRSTVVQTSKVHPGLCSDPVEMLDRLFEQLVG